MKMKKVISLLIIMMMAFTMLTGCGQNAKTGQSKNDIRIETKAADYGEVIIENGDRKIVFTQMPKKVLCCNTYSAENMIMLGLGKYIVGRNVITNPAEVPIDAIADEFNAIPEIEKSHELAVASEADLLIGQVSAFKDSSWGSYEMFKSKGINCYTTSGTIAEDETIENVYYDIEVLGKIFKVEDRAKALIDDIKTKVDNVSKTVGNIQDSDKKKVFVMDSFKDNEIYTTSKGLQSNLIELSHGINCTRNMADSRWFNTSVETIVDTNPDYIIFNDYGKQTIEEKVAFINNNQALKDVTAVKNQAYIILPLVSVMQDARAASACETIAHNLYPTKFK
ncbi:ABC transporter substrate-binding protein [Clostridium uliginosum]|uniref:Iron complex transport system substrate-binding protein n=1 Tax=Clostridium uliginosum TaxID=119641 RepID=A0A1I1PHV5_9CLOT|nr:ABC transporter substrate-binding protein [Clostridium uliginosum]SFD09411.1 iron complex transport system substrate-binding protein [Clostridium uliginosum]